MTDKVVIIVQARLGSTRLPGKILKPLNGYPVLEHVLARCAAIDGRDKVICAGVDDPSEAPVRELCERLGIDFFAGSERDVLARYYLAAKARGADWVVRVTSDCPLLDPGVCRQLIAKVIAAGVDFGITEGWPHGLDCEVVSFRVLEQAWRQADLPEHREHVTLWVKYNKAIDKVGLKPPHPLANLSRYRWVLDYDEDYRFLTAVFEQLALTPTKYPEYSAIVRYLEENPGLCDINLSRKGDWARHHQEILSAADNHRNDR